MPKHQELSGKYLNELWGVEAKHALYREDGKWYHQLLDFPGALFDAHGYVVFETQKDYLESPYLQIQKDVHSSNGISNMPTYVRITENSNLQFISLTAKRILDSKNKYKTDGKTAPHKPVGRLEAERITVKVNRIIRDTKVCLWVKYVHGFKCQICGISLQTGNGESYAEAHHIKPLGKKHNGPDVVENIICVCPNHHALLDLGALKIESSQLHSVEGHEINPEYISYHNNKIFKGAS